jgi:hypothetical protein
MVSILLGNGDGSFGAPTQYATGNSPVAIAVADYNLDGKLDLAFANKNIGRVNVLLGVGDGSFIGSGTVNVVGGAPWSLTNGDWNRDGKPDLAVANFADDTISIIMNTSN